LLSRVLYIWGQAITMQKQHRKYHLVYLAFYQLLASIFMHWRPVEIADARSDNFLDVT